ncbi:toxin-antitoxin system YwqK family antitoxin, partial [Tenacibaculum ovolyticum]|uniref:toxin-antitoxin system YwqK family antitoxin n=1 Tax=Tenacibaculum ovolyticum TaxID=104270 RepID=UPI0018D2DD76
IKYFDKENNNLKLINRYKSDSLIDQIYQNGYNHQYYSNLGNLKSEGIIQNHLFQGIWKFYRKDGKTIKQIVEYKNDTLNGIREDYWLNGNIKTKTTNLKGKIHGLLTEYFENGKLKSKCKYWFDKKKDTSKFYYENGNLKKLAIVELDTISGLSSKAIFEYYETGEFKQVLKSKDSTLTGKVKV